MRPDRLVFGRRSAHRPNSLLFRLGCGLSPAGCTVSVTLNRRPAVSVPRGRPEPEVDVAQSHELGESALATRDEVHGDDLGCTGVAVSDD